MEELTNQIFIEIFYENITKFWPIIRDMRKFGEIQFIHLEDCTFGYYKDLFFYIKPNMHITPVTRIKHQIQVANLFHKTFLQLTNTKENCHFL